MELKDLHRVPYLDGITLLTDRPGRRLSKAPRVFMEVFKLHLTGIDLRRAKDRQEEAKRDYDEYRGSVVGSLQRWVSKGIHGFQFDDDGKPLRIWWFRSYSWRVTDLQRFLRSRAFRSNAAARNAVTISWRMDVLGARELRILEDIFGKEFVDAAKVTIEKDPFQRYSGAKRPPVGTKAVPGQWSIMPEEQWDDEDETDESKD